VAHRGAVHSGSGLITIVEYSGGAHGKSAPAAKPAAAPATPTAATGPALTTSAFTPS